MSTDGPPPPGMPTAGQQDHQKRLMLADRIRKDFTHHPPTGNRGELHKAVREVCMAAALAVVDLCPLGRETSLALTKLEEAMMWANAAIARDGAA